MKKMATVFLLLVVGCWFAMHSWAQEQTEQIQDAGQQVDDTTDAAQAETESESSTSLTITTDGVTTTMDNELGSAYVCTLNDVQRRVEIDLLEPPQPVPCEVNYYKDNEAPGVKTTLWSAQNDSDYCETQAKAFIEKLQGMNWSCSGG